MTRMTGHHIQTGRLGEQLAESFLSSKGYQIIDHNVRTPYGEIDLIACQGSDWIFIEVKTRKTHSMGPPEISVNKRKQEHLVNAVQHYCQNNLPPDTSWRIDVIAIQMSGPNTPPDIIHFENALYA